MRRKVSLILLGAVLCISAAACTGSTGQESTSDSTGVETQAGTEASVDSGAAGTEQQTQIPQTETQEEEQQQEETIYNMGETAQLGEWDVSVTDMQLIESISENYIEYRPQNEGGKYIQVFVTVTNNGKQSNTFLPSFVYGDAVYARILYADGYEFNSTQLLGYSKDLHDSNLNPLTQGTGEILFEVPDTVASSADELLIRFSAGEEAISFKIR